MGITIGLVCLSILLIVHSSIVFSAKPKGTAYMSLTIPVSVQDNPELISITEDFKKRCNRLLIIFILAFALFIPLLSYVSLTVLYLFLYIILVIFFYSNEVKKSTLKIYDLKVKSKWFVGSTKVINIDTKVSSMKNSFPISRLWFLLPLFLHGLLFFSNLIYLAIAISNVLVVYASYEILRSVKTRVYSENSDVNVAINKCFHREWSKCALFLSFIPVSFLVINNIVLWVVFVNIMTLLPILIAYLSVSKLRKELLSGAEIISDEDEYWKTGTYNNPFDNKVFIEKRIGAGATINMGSKGGKIFLGALYVFLLVFIIYLTPIMLDADFAFVEVSEFQDRIVIQFGSDSTTVLKEDIISVELIDKLPSGTRTMGVSSSRVSVGDFNLSGYGGSKLYIMNETKEIILLEIDNSKPVFFNTVDSDETINLFNSISW